MAKTNATQTGPTDSEKVFNLTKDLLDTQKAKKLANQSFNEEIKRLRAEIKEIIEPTPKAPVAELPETTATE